MLRRNQDFQAELGAGWRINVDLERGPDITDTETTATATRKSRFARGTRFRALDVFDCRSGDEGGGGVVALATVLGRF